MQVGYFTGCMCKVDWQKHSQHRKPTVVATLSLDTLSIRRLPSLTRSDWRGRVEGKSSGKGVRLRWPSCYAAGSHRRQMDYPDTQTATSACGDRERGKGMTERI